MGSHPNNNSVPIRTDMNNMNHIMKPIQKNKSLKIDDNLFIQNIKQTLHDYKKLDRRQPDVKQNGPEESCDKSRITVPKRKKRKSVETESVVKQNGPEESCDKSRITVPELKKRKSLETESVVKQNGPEESCDKSRITVPKRKKRKSL